MWESSQSLSSSESFTSTQANGTSTIFCLYIGIGDWSHDGRLFLFVGSSRAAWNVIQTALCSTFSLKRALFRGILAQGGEALENNQAAQAKIDATISKLDEQGRVLREQAISEGYKDEICPRADCGVVLLAHHHFVRCDPATCPMASRQNLNADGEPKTLLEILAE